MSMNSIHKMGLLLAVLFLFMGCQDKTTVTEVKKEVKPTVETKVEEKVVAKVEPRKVLEKGPDLSDVFKDSAKITSNGKYVVLIVDSNSCPHCLKLKKDIAGSKELRERLAKNFTTYRLGVEDPKLHELEHEGEFTKVDTKTLISIYGVQNTPTIIFIDKKVKSIFLVPGYMPVKQFLVTLDFVEQKGWKGLDRKSGKIYDALASFYQKNGIAVKKK